MSSATAAADDEAILVHLDLRRVGHLTFARSAKAIGDPSGDGGPACEPQNDDLQIGDGAADISPWVASERVDELRKRCVPGR